MTAGDRISRHPNSPTWVDYYPYAELLTEMQRSDEVLYMPVSLHDYRDEEQAVFLTTTKEGPRIEVPLDEHRMLCVVLVDETWRSVVVVVSATSDPLPEARKLGEPRSFNVAEAARWLVATAKANGASTRPGSVTEAEKLMLQSGHSRAANRFIPEVFQEQVQLSTSEAWRDGQHQLVSAEMNTRAQQAYDRRDMKGPLVLFHLGHETFQVRCQAIGKFWTLAEVRNMQTVQTLQLPLRGGKAPASQVADLAYQVAFKGLGATSEQDLHSMMLATTPDLDRDSLT